MNIKSSRHRCPDVVVSDLSILDVPPLKGNPFDLRPIERSRSSELVGRDEILIAWREHMHSQSPRMLLLVGERGSGRTSLINALSSQTTRHFVGQYWHGDDPLKRVLSEVSATFCGHEAPKTMHQTVERLVESLDMETGPLPLIALDYPSDVDISSFLSLISPILQRLRALVVISLTNPQLSSIEGTVRELYEEPVHLAPLSKIQIQRLSDSRIRRMAREKWTLNPRLLDSIKSRTGGNPRAVIGLLRDLIDEKRGLGCGGALENLIAWEAPLEDETQPPPLGETLAEPPIEPLEAPQLPPIEQLDELEDDWDIEPDDMWEEEEEEEEEQESLVREQIQVENSDETAVHERASGEESEETSKITDWSSEEGTLLTFEEGTEPPPRTSPKSGFSGLVVRSRDATDLMPAGPDHTPLIEPPSPLPPPQAPDTWPETAQEPTENDTLSASAEEQTPTLDEMRVFSSEGELWTVNSEEEDTLPEPSEEISEDDLSGVIESPELEIQPTDEYPDPEEGFQPSPSLDIAPTEQSSKPIDKNHLTSLNDAEKLVVSVAGEREISPSDAEIQARLEVGRPRLSQIYNSLYRSGILSVRKQGRSRLFKLSAQASELLS